MDEMLVKEMDRIEHKTDRYRFVFEIEGIRSFSEAIPRSEFLEYWERMKNRPDLLRVQYEVPGDIPGGMKIWYTL